MHKTNIFKLKFLFFSANGVNSGYGFSLTVDLQIISYSNLEYDKEEFHEDRTV